VTATTTTQSLAKNTTKHFADAEACRQLQHLIKALALKSKAALESTIAQPDRRSSTWSTAEQQLVMQESLAWNTSSYTA
jgi:hypothetical protein